MTGPIGLIDYGMGNLQSVANSCEFLGKKVRLIAKKADFSGLTHVILPGVGSFGQGMRNLAERGLDGPLKEYSSKGGNLLGICLGMQLLADRGTEDGDNPGLGLVPGRVERLSEEGLRIPHVGWNGVEIKRANALMPEGREIDYYFVHSYFFNARESADVLGVCEYGKLFPCVVGRSNTYGVQFHPEKSHRFGLELLNNFFRMPC